MDPVAYFITFHTYGSWLHGDKAGSVDRKHNLPGAPVLEPDRKRRDREYSQLKHTPLTLDETRRFVVDQAISEVCAHRGWMLHALHVRTNHVHVVVSADRMPERVMNDLKSWATRAMIEAGSIQKGIKAWARHGSTRYLWNEEQVHDASDYVLNRQGAPLTMRPPPPLPDGRGSDRSL